MYPILIYRVATLVVCSLLLGCSIAPYSSGIATKGDVEIVPGEEFYIVIVFEIRGGGESFSKKSLTASLESKDPEMKIITAPISCNPPFDKEKEVRFKCVLDKASKKSKATFFAKVILPDKSEVTQLEFSRLVKKN